MPQFEVAAGSTVGRDHRAIPRNNQDGYAVLRRHEVSVGVVADGCGSSAYSEVGAQLGARLLAEELLVAASGTGRRPIHWQRVQQHVASQIDLLAQRMGDNYKAVIRDYFLFTLVGVVITQKTATFFALGDGTIIINGEQQTLGPFPGNEPPYLGYSLLGDEVAIDQSLVRLQPVATFSAPQLDTFLIATDGIDDFIAHEESTLPGLTKRVGAVSQFWEEDRFFRNPVAVSRQLKLAGRDYPEVHPEPGRLHDDTTLIVGRQIPNMQEEE